MFLQNAIAKRIDNDNPVKVALIGAGKFGSMFLSQVPSTMGIEVLVIADLKPDNALKACKNFNPVILDETKKSCVIQVTALRREIDKMSTNLQKYGLISISRTGAVAMTRGSEVFK